MGLNAAMTVLDLDALAVPASTVVGRLAAGDAKAMTVDETRALLAPATNAQTGTTYTLALADSGELVECANAEAIALTVPQNSAIAFPVGTRVEVLQTGVGQVTLTPDTNVTINAAVGLKISAQWGHVTLIKRATNVWVATGDLSA